MLSPGPLLERKHAHRGYLVRFGAGGGAFGSGGGIGSDSGDFVRCGGFGGRISGTELSRLATSAVNASKILRTVQS